VREDLRRGGSRTIAQVPAVVTVGSMEVCVPVERLKTFFAGSAGSAGADPAQFPGTPPLPRGANAGGQRPTPTPQNPATPPPRVMVHGSNTLRVIISLPDTA
jgi:hypothetical protein